MILKRISKWKKMEEMSQEEKRKIERREENIKMVQAIVRGISSIFTRQRKIDDVCLRNCLFVDKLSCILDIAMVALQSQVDEEWPEDLKLQIHRLSNQINEDLENLMTWVRAPTFSPDNAFGQSIVQNSSFYANAVKNDN